MKRFYRQLINRLPLSFGAVTRNPTLAHRLPWWEVIEDDLICQSNKTYSHKLVLGSVVAEGVDNVTLKSCIVHLEPEQIGNIKVFFGSRK